MTHRSVLVLVVSLVGVLPAMGAAASETYPGVLQRQLGLEEHPGRGDGCTVCHREEKGSVNTATKPFARSLIGAGAVGASVPSLRAALTKLEAEATDSDQDGVSDVDELRAGSDPNVAMTADGGVVSSPIDEVPLPETGCSLVPSRSGRASWLGLLAFVALAFGYRRARNA